MESVTAAPATDKRKRGRAFSLKLHSHAHAAAFRLRTAECGIKPRSAIIALRVRTCRRSFFRHNFGGCSLVSLGDRL